MANETPRDTQRRSESLTSKMREIKRGLTNMAIYRQAAHDSAAIELYAQRLIHFELEDVLNALKTIEDLPRDEGKTAFPEIGIVLDTVRAQVQRRLTRAELSKNKALVIWKCPDCRSSISAFLARGEHDERRCGGNLKPMMKRNTKDAFGHGLEQGQICGARMSMVLDERDA